MKIKLTNIIEIEDPTKEILDFIKKNYTYDNPDYLKKKQMGFSVWKTPKTIKLYDLYNDNVYLPIGCFNDLWGLNPNVTEFVDYAVVKKANIKSNIKLRNYQEPCMNAIKKYVNGIFVLPTGTGKTMVGLECANVLQQKTLWITHTKDLLNQAKERCEQNMTCKTSVITDGKCDVSGDIVFATVQTLVNFVDKRTIKQNEFGLLIVDECHHISTNAESVMMFEQCFNYFSARYKIGLTATLHRADGLDKCIPKIIGNVIYELRKENDKMIGYYEGKKVVEVPANQFQVPAKIHFIKTNYSIEDRDVFNVDGMTINFAKLLTDLTNDNDRNKIILDLVAKISGHIIVISDRVDQLHYLSEKVRNSACIDGKTKKTIREDTIERFRQGKIRVLFASYSLIAEGLDVPILDNIIMASPVKDERVVIQSVGRTQRPYPGKTISNVYDLIDDVSTLQRFLSKRKSVYKKQGWEIK